MQKSTSRDFIKEVLLALKEKEIRATKILLHKFVYFLTLQNHIKYFRFEPYTYGPFSFSLAKEVESLRFWDEIIFKDNSLNLADKEISHISEEKVHTIKGHLDIFYEMAGRSYSFDSLECLGTVLYCMEVLKNQKLEMSFENVKNEFKGWKGNKYPDEKVSQTFSKVTAHLPTAFQ